MDMITAARVWGEGLARLDIAREMDSGYDAGEFSGPAHDKAFVAKERLLRRRAAAAGGANRAVFHRWLHRSDFNMLKNFAYARKWTEYFDGTPLVVDCPR